jgi:Acetyltransferase (GNAT) domain
VSGLAYSALEYAVSLSEFGLPRPLPRSGGWLLEREIPGGGRRDLTGPYPLFSCADWGALGDDVDELTGAVSVVLVADPLAGVSEGELRRVFPDRMAAFKRHYVRDLDAVPRLPEHHRRHVRRASSAVEVEVCAKPVAWLDDWFDLYEQLVERHRLTGVQAFSRAAFRRQLALPGMLAVRAERDGATVGMALWLEDGTNAWYHLAAYSDAGYEVSASYALFAVALAELRERGVRLVDLGGAAGAADADDGLARFKRGWATEERTAWLCGRVLDRAAYDRLAADAATDWFPAYRAPVAAL